MSLFKCGFFLLGLALLAAAGLGCQEFDFEHRTLRSGHTATLLADGRVLVAGGGDSRFEGSAGEYDPKNGKLKPTRSMAQARSGHTATLLDDGRVLVVGGGTASAEVYHPETGTWSPAGSMGRVRRGHTATLLADGRVLIMGGGGTSAEVYNPKTEKWTATDPMTQERSNHTVTLLADGQVLVVGGGTVSAEVYDPKSGQWTVTSSMGRQRRGPAATLLGDDRVLVVGGVVGESMGKEFEFLTSAEVYDPKSGQWTATGSMAQAPLFPSATLLADGRVLVVRGARGHGLLDTYAEVYDPESGQWVATSSICLVRYCHTTLLANGGVLFQNPTMEQWSFTAPGNRSEYTATLLVDGRVLVVGGSVLGSESVVRKARLAEVFDPRTDTWSPVK